MKRPIIGTLAIGVALAGIGVIGLHGDQDWTSSIEKYNNRRGVAPETTGERNVAQMALPSFVATGEDWLIKAQDESGGWGAGQHAFQNVRDPHAVKVDPATTAFAAMALLRTGNTLSDGKYSDNLRKALLYLLDVVEKAPDEGSTITDLTGTQPQRKLGNHIDVSMCAQFFGKVLEHAGNDNDLKSRIEKAIDKCVGKLEGAQQENGSWNAGGWAPVLQSAMANSALEQAKYVGRTVDDKALERSRDYQKDNIIASSGSVNAEAGAGVQLYAISSNQRANANDVAVMKSKVSEMASYYNENGISVTEEDLWNNATADSLTNWGIRGGRAGKLIEARDQNTAVKQMLQDDRTLAGFGNNGGEEFLSFMMTSESLAAEGGEDWKEWREKMENLFSSIQNEDGSWNGHHCITSPVFCTAAVIMAMTADRDTLPLDIE